MALETKFPDVRTCRFGPPAPYPNLIKAAISADRTAWLVTRYEDAKAVLRDPRFSASMTSSGFPLPPQRPGGADMSFLRMDDPEHARHRRLFTVEFTAQRIGRLRPAVQELVDELIDDLTTAGPPVDLVRALALPLPMRVICMLLGVPYRDRAFFEECGNALVDTRRGLTQFEATMRDLYGYLSNHVAAKRSAPGNDMLSRVARAGLLTHEELTAAAGVLLVGGFETTANMISLGMLALLSDPDQWGAVRADAGLVSAAVEELLRYLTVMQFGVPRAALADVVVSGTTIRAGDGVLVLLPNANWDADVFAEPERLDVRRPRSPHLAFGHGAHMCIGAHLARMELRVVLETVLARLPELTLDGAPDDLEFRDHMLIYGVERLPVRW